MKRNCWHLSWKPLVAVFLMTTVVAAAEGLANGADDEHEGVDQYVEVNVSLLPESNTIAAKLPISWLETPANVGTVGAPLIAEQGGRVLSDALTNVSGINIQQQNGVHDYFLIRGFDSINGSLVLTDGAAEPEATYYPIYNVAGVEVLKGPGGFLYGRNPLAGAVNIVREQPLPFDQLSIGGAAGSFGFYETTLDWNHTLAGGDAALRLNGLWTESEHYRNDKDSTQYAVNPSFVWNLSTDSRLTVNLEYVDAEYSPDSGVPVLDPFTTGGGWAVAEVPRRRSYQAPFDFSDQQVMRFQVDFETRLNDTVRLRNKAYYRDLDWRSAGTLISGAFAVAPQTVFVARSYTTLDDRQKFIGNQFEAIVEGDTGRVQHDLLVGLEVARETDDFDLGFLPPEGTPGFEMLPTVPAISLDAPFETFSQPAFVFPLVNGNAEATILAPYVIDRIRFSERWSALVGARYDDIDFEEPVSGIDRSDGKTSPMAGVVFAPADGFALYANGSEAFAPPVSRITPNPEDMADPADFVPEESRQFELGAKKRFLDGKIQTVLSLYDLQRDNIGVPDATGTTLQIGDQQSRGVELEVAAEPARRLRVLFSYAYNDAELTRFSERIQVPDPMDPMMLISTTVDYSGNRPAYAPQHLANAWLSKRLDRLTVAGGLRFVGAQFIDENNLFEIDSSLVADAMVSYVIGNWRIRANLRNITDEEYETRGFGGFSVIPADAFSAALSFEYTLR